MSIEIQSARNAINRFKSKNGTRFRCTSNHYEANVLKAETNKRRQQESRIKNTFNEDEFVYKRSTKPKQKKTVVRPSRQGVVLFKYKDYTRFLHFTAEIVVHDEDPVEDTMIDLSDYDTIHDL